MCGLVVATTTGETTGKASKMGRKRATRRGKWSKRVIKFLGENKKARQKTKEKNRQQMPEKAFSNFAGCLFFFVCLAPFSSCVLGSKSAATTLFYTCIVLSLSCTFLSKALLNKKSIIYTLPHHAHPHTPYSNFFAVPRSISLILHAATTRSGNSSSLSP